MIRLATNSDVDIVQSIVYQTIKSIYPLYYPEDVVDFFLNHHSYENILADIGQENVILLSEQNQYIATGTCDGEYMNRVFVIPNYQGKGYGYQVMDFIEKKIALKYRAAYIHSSLPAFHLYLKRGYEPIEYHKEIVQNNRFLCYHIMKKDLYKEYQCVNLYLGGKCFVSTGNTNNGEVSSNTIFHYHQQNEIIWATYSGGNITKGYLLGKFIDKATIRFTYQHINVDKQMRIGECESQLEILPDQRIRLYENWQWLDGDKSKGNSIIEEIKA